MKLTPPVIRTAELSPVVTNQRLIICLEESDIPTDCPAIDISKLLANIDEEDANALYGRLLNIEVDHDYELPIYRLVAQQIWLDGSGLHEHSPRSLELLVILYRQLAEQVSEDTEVLECIGVSGRYLDLVRDFADNENLQLLVKDPPEETITDRSFLLEAIIWLIISVFDAMLSVLVRPLFSRTDADVLVKYPVFRPETFQPIERRLNVEFVSTSTLLTISYIKRVHSDITEETPFIPIRCFGSISGMLSDYRTMAMLGFDLAFDRGIESAIVAAVEAETDVRLPNTVGRLFRRAVLSNVKTFLYTGTANRLFENGNYRSLLLTSTGPTAKALALPAELHGVKTYVLHHSMTTPRELYDGSFRRTIFSEGTIVEEALRKSGNEEITPVATGMPKHLDIADRRRDNLTTDGPNTVLLGTQPFPDDYRREFVHDVVPALLDSTRWNVLVKIHPGEEAGFYHRTLREVGIDTAENDRVRVAGGNLYEYVQECDLLVTVNSNVGIESVILGTPAIMYNAWSPNFRDPLYTTYGTVPRCEEVTELIQLLVDSDLDGLFEKQLKMINGPYMVTGNSIDSITARIERELVVPKG